MSWFSLVLLSAVYISETGMLAKICSDVNKPNGQTSVEPNRDKIIAFMEKLAFRKIQELGRITELTFKEMGMESCKDVVEQAHELAIAYEKLTDSFNFYIQAAHGTHRLSTIQASLMKSVRV